MAEKQIATVSEPEAGKLLPATPGAQPVEPPSPARGWSRLNEQTVNRVLFAIFVAFLVLYPVIDRGLGIGRMGSMNPILVFMLLALGLNIVVGFAGLLD